MLDQGITRVPDASHRGRNHRNLRGEIIPIVDLTCKLGLHPIQRLVIIHGEVIIC